MSHRVVAESKGVVTWKEFTPTKSEYAALELKAVASLISTGTEGIILNGLFEPGSHYDNFVKYPYHLGYCWVGEDAEGRRMFTRRGHASHQFVSPQQCYAVPDSIPSEHAIWAALAMVGSMSLKAGEISLHDAVLIIGAGPIGQMALRWCVATGARVIVIDPVEVRLEIAKKGGAIGTFAGPLEAAENFAIEVLGTVPRVVIDTTGIPSVFEKALALPRNHGTLVLLGDTGKPSEQRLTPDVVIRGVKIHGAHISHETPDWTEAIVYDKFFELISQRKFEMESLNTHCFAPQDCVEAYHLMTNNRSETMGIWFDWTKYKN